MYVIHIIIFACSHVYILIYTYSFIYKHVVSETLPNSLQSLTFSDDCNQSMERVELGTDGMGYRDSIRFILYKRPI